MQSFQLLPDQNSYISGWKNKEGIYRFAKDLDFYYKLPIGEKEFIVVISYKDDVPYLSIKEFKIKGDEKFEMTLLNYTFNDFKTKLESINN